MRASRTAIEGVDARFEHAARAMGSRTGRVALQVTLPLARRGIAAGLTIGCARALGEYGATLLVGGDMNGKTRTLSLAILDSFTTPERKHDVADPGADGGDGDDRRGPARPEQDVTAALEVDVARRLGEFDLEVAFAVESGISVLFGPSGAARPLTLALIAGLARPDSGTIAINGRVVTDAPAASTSPHRSGAWGWCSRKGCCSAPHRARQRRARRPAGTRAQGTPADRARLARAGRRRRARRAPARLALGRPAPTRRARTRARRRSRNRAARRAALGARPHRPPRTARC